MFKYIKIVIPILIIAVLFSSCTTNSFVNSKINDALAQNRSSDNAIEWLTYNSDLVAPVLTSNLSSNSQNKVNETKELLTIMGKEGVALVLSNYNGLSESGKAALCDVLAAQNDKESIMQLLAMSTLDGGFDVSVATLIKMGETATDFLKNLIYQDNYYECVNAVLAGDSPTVIEDIIPMVSDSDLYIQNRALEILALSSSDVIAPFVQSVLSDTSLTNEKAIRISNIALYNNRETAVDEIISISALGNADPLNSATMLYEISKDDDLAIIFEKCARSSNAINTNEMLKEFVNQAGVPRIIETALNTQSSETLTSISFALATYEHSLSAFVEILNNVSDADDSSSSIYQLAHTLIYEPGLSGIAKAIIATDYVGINTALQLEGANPKTIGQALSQTSQNPTISIRLNNMLNQMDYLSARSTLIMLAYGEDAVYPKLVWDRYISGDYNLSKSAMDVILEATSVGIKFQYTDMDFLPYADKLIQDLNSVNSEIKTTALLILNKIPEGVEHHDFYMKVYEGYKEQDIFAILCWHYVGEGARKLNLSLEGTSDVINEIAYDIKSIKVQGIDSDDFIDYEGMIKQSLNTLGLQIVDDANTELAITINETPISKYYRGLIGDSYLGAKCTITIEVYVAGQKINTVSGYFEILPPADNPVGNSYSEYMSDPTDAPLETPFITSYVQALYKAFGEEVLFGTYQYDRQSTLVVGMHLWQ